MQNENHTLGLKEVANTSYKESLPLTITQASSNQIYDIIDIRCLMGCHYQVCVNNTLAVQVKDSKVLAFYWEADVNIFNILRQC